MATYNEKQIEKMLLRLSSRTKLNTDRGECPKEESLAVYLCGGLDENAQNNIERHLANCLFCMSEVVAVNRATNEADAVPVPRWLMARAMGLMKPAATGRVLELVVKLVRDTVELVSSAGEWLVPVTPQAIFARGKAAPGPSSILQVESNLEGYRIGVEVEQVDSGICQVAISLADGNGNAQDGVRLTLVADEREQASYITRQGQAVFGGVARGDYDLILSKGPTTLGTIQLKIEAES